MTSAIESIAFIGTVLVVALGTWMMRSFVESDPDPFYLNLSFFALGGQCIRTIEYFADRNIERRPALMLLAALFIGIFAAVFQLSVMRAHMRVTMDHYKLLLTQYKADACSDSEIKKWAAALLQITGTDFSPGSYGWLRVIFDSDPSRLLKN